jgi:hypothetical protein
MNTIESPWVDNTPLGAVTEFLRSIGRSDNEVDPGEPDFIDSAARAIPEINALLDHGFREDPNLLGGRMFGAGVTFGAMSAIAVLNGNIPINSIREIKTAIEDCVAEIEVQKEQWLDDCNMDQSIQARETSQV